MEKIGKLTVHSDRAYRAAQDFLSSYIALERKTEKRHFSKRYLKDIERLGSVWADLIQLVALGMDVCHEQPVTPRLFRAASKIMRAHGIAPKIQPCKAEK